MLTPLRALPLAAILVVAAAGAHGPGPHAGPAAKPLARQAAGHKATPGKPKGATRNRSRTTDKFRSTPPAVLLSTISVAPASGRRQDGPLRGGPAALPALVPRPGPGGPGNGPPPAHSPLAVPDPDGWTVEANPDGAYGRNSMDWSIPVNVTASTLTTVGDRIVAVRAGVRSWADTPTGRQRHWGICFGVSIPFSH
ncbi:MAG: hypothetical protein ACJ8LG_06095 [Massilia sp.]